MILTNVFPPHCVCIRYFLYGFFSDYIIRFKYSLTLDILVKIFPLVFWYILVTFIYTLHNFSKTKNYSSHFKKEVKMMWMCIQCFAHS